MVFFDWRRFLVFLLGWDGIEVTICEPLGIVFPLGLATLHLFVGLGDRCECVFLFFELVHLLPKLLIHFDTPPLFRIQFTLELADQTFLLGESLADQALQLSIG